jgi:hypothetical protein
MKTAIVLLLLFGGPYFAFSQCASAPLAAAACSGGNGPASSGANINSGNTYWFSGGPSTFSGINLNGGGTFRVCGTLTLSSMTYNGGTLIVENGGNLTINATMNVSGTTIINRGSLTINGNLTLQGSNNAVYNDLSTSVFTVNGTLTLNGTTSFLYNRGIVNATTLHIQGTTGAVCMENNSIVSVTQLDNDYTNAFSYASAGGAACLKISTTAVLNNDVASSAKIHVCTSAIPSGGASTDATRGWGLATVTSGCSTCATVLAVNDVALSAEMGQGLVNLQWTSTADISAGDIFILERSVDGKNFSTLSSWEAKAGQMFYTAADAEITSARQYYRIRLVSPSAGTNRYSPVVAVATGYDQAFAIYPNPAARGGTIHLLFSSPASGPASLTLINLAGQTMGSGQAAVSKGNNHISWKPGLVAPGLYIIRIVTPDGGLLNGRLTVLPI